MLLSAGLGTRLRPYTLQTPKPAVPFLTVPLAAYSLSHFERLKIDRLVVNTHHLPQQVEKLFRGLDQPCKELIFSHEPQILGSGGGIREALPHLIGHDSFVVANADEVILPEHFGMLEEALAFHRWHKGLATLIAMQHPQVGTKFGGLWLPEGSESKVQGFSKTPVTGCRGLHFLGMMILRDEIKNYFQKATGQEENILYDTLTSAMQKGQEVHAFSVDAQWFETGNPDDLCEATEICLQAMLKSQPPNWAQGLSQILRRWSQGQYLVEKDRLALLHRLQQALPKILAGE